MNTSLQRINKFKKKKKKRNYPKNLKILTKTKTIEGSWPHRGPA